MQSAFVHTTSNLPLMDKQFLRNPTSTSISALRSPKQTFPLLSTKQIPRPSLSAIVTDLVAITTLQSQDVILTGTLLTAACTWLTLWQRLTSLNLVPSSVTRKVVHVSCGPLFVALWPLYSDAPSACLLASMVPFCFIALLTISGYAREDQTTRAALGRAISREGKAADALQGPLYYSIVLLMISLFFFKSPISVIVVAQLCFGDGAAEIVGKRFGSKSQWGLPWTGNKSIAGSAAFFFAALTSSCMGLAWWDYWELVDIQITSAATAVSLTVISAGCAALELIPKELAGDDNLTVAAAATAMGLILFGSHSVG